MTTLIEQLAAAKGIASEYVDAWGHPAQVSEEQGRHAGRHGLPRR